MSNLIQDLPVAWRESTLLGRVLLADGPTPVLVRRGRVLDISRWAPTTADALAQPDVLAAEGEDLGDISELAFRTAWGEDQPGQMRVLSPADLQCIKASGVTFAVSAVERVIEERARGDASRAAEIRAALAERVGADLRAVRPGSEQAMRLKAILMEEGLWSQYLEVAIGKDAEIFTKCPVLASVGWGEHVGVRSDSAWNNPEPEVVLACNSEGAIRGATLGNDVNLRDIEGRSALLLGKAKDNNASAALGPFIRLFDANFSLDDVRKAEVTLEVEGEDGFSLRGRSSMAQISRDPEELVRQTIGPMHQYPDGFMLYLGTMFAPTENRGAEGQGFTHRPGDRVRVSCPELGGLRNVVTSCEAAPPWTMGVSALMHNLSRRGLL